MNNNKLTNKQKVFVEHYLETWNATEAARRANYKGSDNTLRVVGHENLTKPNIKARIEARLKEMTLNADEIIQRLSDQATSSIAEFIKPIGSNFQINMEAVQAKGHLIKKIKHNMKGGVEIELYDSQAALVHLGRHHQLWTDKIKVEDWRSDVIQLLQDGKITQQDVIDELGQDLATELFIGAKISVGQSGQSGKQGSEG